MDVTEGMLQEAAVAPRVTLEQLEATIVGEFYFSAEQGAVAAVADSNDTIEGCLAAAVKLVPHQDNLKLLTFCVLVLQNGFCVTGESACADPKNFNAEIGKALARKQAVGKVWPLLGYELKSKVALVAQGTSKSDPYAKTYIGMKVIHASPLSRGEYNRMRGWPLPSDENPADEGYLVEYADGGKPTVEGFRGYVSWSPKAVFEAAYKEFV